MKQDITVQIEITGVYDEAMPFLRTDIIKQMAQVGIFILKEDIQIKVKTK